MLIPSLAVYQISDSIYTTDATLTYKCCRIGSLAFVNQGKASCQKIMDLAGLHEQPDFWRLRHGLL